MGPCTANARQPTVDSRCRGTIIICCVADLRRCLLTTSAFVGMQNSFKNGFHDSRQKGVTVCHNVAMCAFCAFSVPFYASSELQQNKFN